MKIAIVSDDEATISKHFGRAIKYMIYLVKQGQVLGPEVLPKKIQCHSRKHRCKDNSTSRGLGQAARKEHDRNFEDIIDCDLVVSRGMGRGAYRDLMRLDVQPIITDITRIDDAIGAIMDGSIVNHSDQLH